MSSHAYPNRRLTPPQERFCREYVLDSNATKAAKRAGYSPHSASAQGSQLLSHTRVQARIAELQAERNARMDVDADFVLKRLVEEVNADAGDLYGDDGKLLPVKQWPAPWRRGLVSSIQSVELYSGDKPIGTLKTVQLVDRVRRLELLGKHIKVNAFAERVQIGMDTPLAELFRQIQGNVIRPRTIEHEALPELTHEAQAAHDDES